MKFTFAIIALIASTSAVRFTPDNHELSEAEEMNLVRSSLIAENAIPHSNELRASSFSESLGQLHNDQEDWDARFRASSPQEFRMTEHTKRPVIQQSEDHLTNQEKMELIREDNDSIQIRHTAPLADMVEEIHPRSFQQVAADREQYSARFAKYIDDKDFDTRIETKNLSVLGY